MNFKYFNHKHLNKLCINVNTHVLFYCPSTQMPFVCFLFVTIGEFMIVCFNMCEGIRVEVRARIHAKMLKVMTAELRVLLLADFF